LADPFPATPEPSCETEATEGGEGGGGDVRWADDYSEVHLTSGRPALVDVTLRRWELRLPTADFVRIHRSSLVNLHHVAEVRYTDGHWEVAMRASGGTETLTVSRRVGRELGDRLRQRSVRVL
jgi:DNA-binding LytR/AlgR family response regulator